MYIYGRRDDFFFFYAGLFGVRSSFCSSPVWEIYESRPPSVPNLLPSPTFLPLTHPFCPWKLIRNAVSQRKLAPPPPPPPLIHASQEF